MKTALLLLLALAAPASCGELAVGLYSLHQVRAVEIESAGGAVLLGERSLPGRCRIQAKGGAVLLEGALRAGPQKELSLSAFGAGAWLSGPGLPRRLYRGRLAFTAADGRLKIINFIDAEAYLPGVVAGEAPDLSQVEMLKAQAIAARTYAVAHRHNHARDGYNMCDSTHCQLYPGLAGVTPAAAEAVSATGGEMLYFRGSPAMAYYHSSCGGRTETMSYVWPFESKPYLVSVRDGPPGKPYCAAATDFRWKTRIYFTGLTRLARETGWIDGTEEARGLRVSAWGVSGRAAALELYTKTRRIAIPATEFYHGIGRRAGWKAVRSSYFTITAGKDYIELDGKGSGHGVGMCQWGAEGMAKKGFRYREILKHYYPGTEIRQ